MFCWNDASLHPLGDIFIRTASFALHFLPALSIGSDGSIRTSWYDRRLGGADSRGPQTGVDIGAQRVPSVAGRRNRKDPLESDHARADAFGAMMNQHELEEAIDVTAELRSELEVLRRQLAAARAKNLMWRSVIEQHLNKGCRSQSLRALLDADPHPNDL